MAATGRSLVSDPVSAPPVQELPVSSAAAFELIRSELDEVAGRLSTQAHQIDSVAAVLLRGHRIFTMGLGRSGLALQMTGMRLMHLGLQVHVVGETTTPAISHDDVLFVASGSGTTGGVVRAAQQASDVDATIIAITTTSDSPLGELADVVIHVPAAGKLDRSGTSSAQYAGSLFEQSVVVVGDALFHALWKSSDMSADQLWSRHANLE